MRVPNFKDIELTKFLSEVDREISNNKRDALSAVTGNRALMLISPSNKVFEVKVSDAGALIITKVAG